MENIVKAVMDAMQQEKFIQIEVSARHVHLSEEAVHVLFGEHASLTSKRELSQKGQYLSEERVTIIGSKGKKEHVAILGPVRPENQVELSRSDCIALGIDAPVRQSGDTKGSGVLILEGPHGRLELTDGVIVAANHIHMTPETAKSMGLKDKQHVKVTTFSKRPVTFEKVLVRVHESFRTRMHIDVDEANAAMISGFAIGKIIDQ